MASNKYIIKAALSEDINSSYIWFSSLPCSSREIVKIINTNTAKTVWCEVIVADDNYIKRYNQNPKTKDINKDIPFIVMNEWYREKLGLNKNIYCEIKIKSLWIPASIRQLYASLAHPDNTVRLAAYLAFISVGLGVAGLILGFISLCT